MESFVARGAVAALAILALSAPSAVAGEAAVDEGPPRTLVYEAEAGETNRVSFQLVGPETLRVHDQTAPVTAGGGCVAVDANTADCRITSVADLGVALDDGADQVDLAGVPAHVRAEVDAGDGDDWLLGSPANDELEGGLGNDVLLAGGGNDEVEGAEGNDVLAGEGGDDTFEWEPGGDAINGGDGDDLVSYAAAGGPVSASLDGQPNDGRPGEGDNIHADVEGIDGSQFADVIGGNDASNELDGLGGADSIDGGGGADGVSGGRGADSLDGGPGRDFISGGASADAITSRDGQPGTRRRGRARRAQAGGPFPDRVSCGGGEDSVTSDALDDVDADCDTVRVPAPLRVSISRRVVATETGFVLLRIRCPRGEMVCTGVVKLTTSRRIGSIRRKVGEEAFRISGGRTGVVKLEVAPKVRRLLARRGSIGVVARATNRNADTGRASTARRALRLRARDLV